MRVYGLVALIVLLGSSVASAYTVHINALAVLVGVYQGISTPIYLNVTPGTGIVNVTAGNAAVGSDTVQSARYAVAYATSYLGVNESSYNFNFSILSAGSNVSGPSAGLPLTLLTIAALKHTQLPQNLVATGTISTNGSVGPIGGIFDKARSAKTIGANVFLVPYVPNDSFEYTLYYLSQQSTGIPIVEVSNAIQAVPYAFSNRSAVPLTYNISYNYKTGSLANITTECPSCTYNGTGFEQLANVTFDIAQREVNSINGSKFGSLKSQLEGLMAQYLQIKSKGYLYTSSDLVFLTYPTAFLFGHYSDSNMSSASAELENITNYCTSLTPPQMTALNYQYVVSGEARYAWAMDALSQSQALLNSSQSSDQVLSAIAAASRAYAWCAAVSQLYNTSSGLGAQPLAASQQIQSVAAQQISAAKSRYGNLPYVNESEYSYSIGQYAAALYTLAYADTFYNTTALSLNASNSTEVGAVVSLAKTAASSANGTWPKEFVIQSYFYLQQANASSANATAASSYLSSAYSTLQLSFNIDKADSTIMANLAPGATVSLATTSQIYALESRVVLMYWIIVVLMIIIIVLVVGMAAHALSHKKARPGTRNGRRARKIR